MDIRLAIKIVAMISTAVRVRPGERSCCVLCNTAGQVQRTVSDPSAILRYLTCPACGLHFRSVQDADPADARRAVSEANTEPSPEAETRKPEPPTLEKIPEPTTTQPARQHTEVVKRRKRRKK